MRILVVNPNTTAPFTATILAEARAAASPGSRVDAATAPFGPVAVESQLDEAVAAVAALEAIAAAYDAYDGFVIACYGDPGLYAARELGPKPVAGIAEASMLLACALGARFSLLATLDRERSTLRELVRRYGLEERLASVRPTGRAVLAFGAEGPGAARDAEVRALAEAGRAAVEADGAEVLCLACAGMAGVARRLQDLLGVPVVDGVAAAVRQVETQLALGLSASPAGLFAPPGPKDYVPGFGPALEAAYRRLGGRPRLGEPGAAQPGGAEPGEGGRAS